MLKKLFILLLVLALLGAGIVAVLYAQVNTFGQQIIELDKPLVIHLRPGQSAQSVYRGLPLEHSQMNAFLFKAWLRLNPKNSQVKTGYYSFDDSTTLSELFDTLYRGKQTQFSIALVEGLTIRQWIDLIGQIDTLRNDLPELESLYDAVTQAFSQRAMQKVEERATAVGTHFCKNEMRSLEGCLLADTYFYSYQDSALSILTRAFAAMDSALDDAWEQRYPDIPINSPYEALILASIIEKETAVANERGIIAGVFSNRLERNMRLQTDPTVIYGIGPEFDGDITRAHLKEKTPYNTYRIKGLPPTPIAMAGKASLMAAVQPEITDYLYFVAKGDGSHYFSTNLEEHNKAVVEFQLNRK